MKTSSKVSLGMLMFCTVLSYQTIALRQAYGDELIRVVYRDADGNLTRASLTFAKQMIREATESGYVTLWLTSSVPFNPYLDQLTEKQIAEQNENVQVFFEEILTPLINAGVVWHPKSGTNIRGPGCLVHANSIGVKRLAADSRLLHIVEVEKLPNSR